MLSSFYSVRLSPVFLQLHWDSKCTPSLFPLLSSSVISTSRSPSCSSWSDWIFLFKGHQEGLHALSRLLVCECDTTKATVWSSCGWDCVIYIFAPYLCVRLSVCVCVCEDMQMMHVYFFSRILLIRHLGVYEPWLFWLMGHGFGIGRRVPLVVFVCDFVFLFKCHSKMECKDQSVSFFMRFLWKVHKMFR